MATSRRVIATVNHTYARQESRPMSQSNCDLVLQLTSLPVLASTNIGGCFGNERHSKAQTPLFTVQLLISLLPTSFPLDSNSLADTSVLSGRTPHFTWPSAMST